MRQKITGKIIEKLKENYQKFADEFNETRKHPWPEFEWLKEYIGEGDKVLEIGCGNGRLLESLKEKNIDYTGVDFCRPLLEQARKKYKKAEFIEGDITKMHLQENEYDKIIFIAALHHIPSRKLRIKVMKNINGSLRENGFLMVSVWRLWQWKYARHITKGILRFISSFGTYAWNDLFIPWKGTGRKKPLPRYYHAFTRNELKNLLGKTGFSIVGEYSSAKNKRVNNYTYVCKKNMRKAVQQPIFEKDVREKIGNITQPATSQKL